MKKVLLLIACLIAAPAFASEITLNDLPGILQKLRGCSTNTVGYESCKIDKANLWVSVAGDGSLTLFRQKSYGDTTYARGKNVPDLLHDFAVTLNREQTTNKEMLESISTYLPTQ